MDFLAPITQRAIISLFLCCTFIQGMVPPVLVHPFGLISNMWERGQIMQTDWKMRALSRWSSERWNTFSGFSGRISLGQEYQTQGRKLSQVLKELQNEFQIMGRNWILNILFQNQVHLSNQRHKLPNKVLLDLFYFSSCIINFGLPLSNLL